MSDPLYAVIRWPTGAIYAGPPESASAFGAALMQASVVVLAPRSHALRLAAFGTIRPVVPGERSAIPSTLDIHDAPLRQADQQHP